MVAATAKSIVAAMSELGQQVQFVVILDGCGDEYANLYETAVAKAQNIALEIIRTDKIGNAATWNLQIEIAQRAQYDAKYVFFVEDDYLFAKNALVAMADFLDSGMGDFVSPLDHPGLYRLDGGEDKMAGIAVSSFGHWRTLHGTCMTFMMRRDLVPRILSQSAMYQYNFSDTAFWVLLLKWRICNPLTWIRAAWSLIRYGLNRNYSSFYLTYVHILRRQGLKPLFYKRYKLWTPIPTLAVHINTCSLPLFSEKYFEDCQVQASVLASLKTYLRIR